MKNQMIRKIALAFLFIFSALSASFSQNKNQNPLTLYRQGLEYESQENWFDAGQAFLGCKYKSFLLGCLVPPGKFFLQTWRI